MEDLGEALSKNHKMIMMGGGNPAQIPEITDFCKKRLSAISKDTELIQNMIGDYDPPQGNKAFIKHLCKLLKNQFGWSINEKNIALTNGSQSAFFMIFNLLAGEFEDGSKKKIQLPITPEYILVIPIQV